MEGEEPEGVEDEVVVDRDMAGEGSDRLNGRLTTAKHQRLRSPIRTRPVLVGSRLDYYLREEYARDQTYRSHYMASYLSHLPVMHSSWASGRSQCKGVVGMDGNRGSLSLAWECRRSPCTLSVVVEAVAAVAEGNRWALAWSVY